MRHRVPIAPNPTADFRTQVLTLAERLVLAAEENEPLSSARSPPAALVRRHMLAQMLRHVHRFR